MRDVGPRSGETRSRRTNGVGGEPKRMRQRERERERMAGSQNQNKARLRPKPSTMFKSIVDSLNLASWLGTEKAKETLAMAGFRGAGAEYAFLTFRFVAP